MSKRRFPHEPIEKNASLEGFHIFQTDVPRFPRARAPPYLSDYEGRRNRMGISLSLFLIAAGAIGLRHLRAP
jgi:hypothetical protein